MNPKFYKLIIKDIRKETKDTVSIAFDVPNKLFEDFQFFAGQYLTLKAFIDNKEIRRSYSLCSAPHEIEWRVAVKEIENGKFSRFANHTLKKGHELEVMMPTGNFKLKTENNSTKSYVLFAAGSGITPIFSILKTILIEENSDVTLFYGNKGFSNVIFREELETLKNKFLDRLRIIHLFSQESIGNKIQKGRIDKDKCDSLFNAFLQNQDIDAVFICGPESMVLGVTTSLIEHGVEKEKIHFELFGVAIKPTIKENKIASFGSQVEIIIDGDSLSFDLDSNGESILDAAFNAGADLPFACKGGVCCTCKAKILKGSARMDVNYALSAEELEKGYILTCQAHPTDENVVISFDD